MEEKATSLEIELRFTLPIEIALTIDAFESNFLMCTEEEKKEYGFSIGKRVNFAGHHHFSDALLGGNTLTNETLDH